MAEEVADTPAESQDSGPGYLMVGTNHEGQVVINLDHDRTGHIIFSPRQARYLAGLLNKKASEAERFVTIDVPSNPR